MSCKGLSGWTTSKKRIKRPSCSQVSASLWCKAWEFTSPCSESSYTDPLYGPKFGIWAPVALRSSWALQALDRSQRCIFKSMAWITIKIAGTRMVARLRPDIGEKVSWTGVGQSTGNLRLNADPNSCFKIGSVLRLTKHQ